MRGLGKDVFLASLLGSEEELGLYPVTFRLKITLFLCFPALFSGLGASIRFLRP